jgi:hypothetical protein
VKSAHKSPHSFSKSPRSVEPFAPSAPPRSAAMTVAIGVADEVQEFFGMGAGHLPLRGRLRALVLHDGAWDRSPAAARGVPTAARSAGTWHHSRLETLSAGRRRSHSAVECVSCPAGYFSADADHWCRLLIATQGLAASLSARSAGSWGWSTSA